MKDKYYIYVFRHGRTFDNIESRFSGWRDSKLTPSGVDDAKIVAIRLKDKKIQAAIHTRLTRSQHTLKIALQSHKECVTLFRDDKMIERSYGSLAGKTHLAIVKKYGPEQYDQWHRGFHHRLPKGESFADVEKRVGKFVINLSSFIKKRKCNVAISAHGNSIRLFRKIIEKKTEKEAVTWEIPYDKVFTYSIEFKGKKAIIKPAKA